MDDKMKLGIQSLVKLLISAAIAFGAWYAGSFYFGTMRTWITVAAVSGAVIVFAIIANLICFAVFKRLPDKIKAKTAQDFAENIMRKVQANYAKSRRNVNLILAFSYIYVILMIALAAVAELALAHIIVNKALSAFTAILIAIFVLYPFVDVFFGRPESPVPPAGRELAQGAFPMLYDTARAAAKKLGCDMPVRLFMFGSDVSVTVHRGSIIIMLDSLCVATLTRAELYNVMLHEVAHVINKDSARGRRHARAEAMFSFGNDKYAAALQVLYTIIPTLLTELAISTYSALASRHHEIEADAKVMQAGDKQAYVNATAKARLLTLYKNIPRRELDYDFYAPEKATADYAAQELKLFAAYLKKYGERWLRVLDLEIPARVDSHPTFKMRREAFGCESYAVNTVETDENYKAEQVKSVQFTDNALRLENENFYYQMRENNYVSVKNKMDEYDKAVADGAPLTEPQKVDAMRIFYGIDNDKAVAIADELLAVQPDAPTANFLKGLVLFNELDDGCIPYFERAGKFAQYADPALDHIGVFYLLTGKQTEIEQYRKDSADLKQKALDVERSLRITRKTEMTSADIDKDTAAALVERIRKETKLKVNKIYIAKYTDAMNRSHYPVVMIYNKILEKSPSFMEEMNAAYTAVGSFSDKYDFIPCYGNKGLNRKIVKAPNSLYYDSDAKLKRR